MKTSFMSYGGQEVYVITVESFDFIDRQKIENILIVRQYEIGLIDYFIELQGSTEIIN